MNLLILCLLALQMPETARLQTPPRTEKVRREEDRKVTREFFQDQIDEGRLGWKHFAPEFKRLADERADDWVGYEALTFFVIQGTADGPEFSKSLDLLLRHHVEQDGIRTLVRQFVSVKFFGPDAGKVEQLLREVAKRHRDPGTRAEATFCLADFLKYQGETARRLAVADEKGAAFARRIERTWGAAVVKALKSRDAGKLIRDGEAIERQARVDFSEYADTRILTGRAVPEIKGTDLEGQPMTFSEFRGKVVVLSFWGFGCPPCRAMFPDERAMVARLEREPFALLGVCNDRDLKKVRGLIAKEKITWRSWWDDADTDAPIAQAWVIRVWPAVFVIDPKGIVRYRDLRGEELDLVVDTLLEEAKRERPATPPLVSFPTQSHTPALIGSVKP